MWSGEKLKPPTKDTHTLRLNLKSPENRQRYPPDEDLDAIHVISSEYEVAKPVSSDNNEQLSNSTEIYHTSHDPRFLPKLKYGAVSKSYLKKLSSIFTQHHLPSKQIFFEPGQVKQSENETDTTLNMFRCPSPHSAIDVEDEGHCSLSDNDDSKDNTNLCDTKKGPVVGVTINQNKSNIGAISKSLIDNNIKQNVKNQKNHAYSKHVMENNKNFSNKNNSQCVHGKTEGKVSEIKSGDDEKRNENTGAVEKRVDNGQITQFSLPRITLNKQQQGSPSCEVDSVASGFSTDTRKVLLPQRSSSGSTVTVGGGRRRRSTGSSSGSNGGSTVVVGGRISSHYSTEKSGSSGYYGSNLYSGGGSVVEEHIYSEPVIVEHAQVHATDDTLTKDDKERECLSKLNNSITNLENCLPGGVDGSSTKVSLRIANRRRISIPRDGTIPRPVWPSLDADDSLAHVNFEQFSQSKVQVVDALKLKRKSDDVDSGKASFEGNYIDVIDYHQTREILVNIRGKLDDLLEKHRTNTSKKLLNKSAISDSELERNIISLKNDLENYLVVMNEKQEDELRRFSAGLISETKMLTVKKALDNRNKICRFGDDCYEVIIDEPFSDFGSYDPKMKVSLRRTPSIEKGDFILTCNEIINPYHPAAPPTVPFESTNNSTTILDNNNNNSSEESSGTLSCLAREPKCMRHGNLSQMQKNLAFSQLLNETYIGGGKYGDDRERMLSEWHRDKPSIWEMYYGTNRYSSKIEPSVLREYCYAGKHRAMNVSYPSTRPESDFTLDVPRVEELRIKMEKEKQFRKRCRLITYFLGLLIFLLTVMIVSLVLTRGKRMFGSMI